ncbi:hypothetical protein [Sphingobacterium sp. 1.A.4]|uniref:hypothetical protein n=1 Tax=Sphingobacterium sp. 1.A.4 TaxID=2044603 RepID=UPI000C0BD976|nr:hypothetical protein [Sphingobacterium sp. 1.A.4]
MGLKFSIKINKGVINKALSKAVDEVIEVGLNHLIDTGREFIRYAKANKQFQNQTHNLVTSMGFGIAQNGRVIYMEFDGIGEEGMAKGESLVNEVASTLIDPSLICVAGENYAVHVEKNGFNVMSNFEPMFFDLLKNSR